MTFRSLVFWPHLVAGLLAGVVILVMSVTGVLLTYEKQMVAWADARTPIASGPDRLPPEALLEHVEARAGALPASLAISAAERPVIAAIGQRTVLVDPYSGAILGDSAPRLRRFFRKVTEWHRWLALGGNERVAGRTLTAWANVIFLFIIVSGTYLWVPRVWSRQHIRAVAWFKRGAIGKGREFNWHHVIGIWSAVPLALIVASAMPISFPWANALIYRMVGETPPAAAARPATPRPSTGTTETASVPVDLRGLDKAWRIAAQQVSDWRTITMRVPQSARADFVFTIDQGSSGQPQYRGSATIDRNGQLLRWEPFESQSLGRRIRSISRFLHTGEVLGIAGQTIAGAVTLGAVFLVWTGTTLAIRRFWRSRRAPASDLQRAA
jgi:uncharacterized iron-regulated membrane protein